MGVQIWGIAMVLITFLSLPSYGQRTICTDEKVCFNVEVARTERTRNEGLMYRRYLPKISGMLFVFPHEDKHAFWMKNTYIPLDIIWINRLGKIVWVSENTPPCRVDPCPIFKTPVAAKYVLEINAGLARKHGLHWC